jgi:serine/threonine-protein kinase
MTDGPQDPDPGVETGTRPTGRPAKIGRYEIVRELGRGMMGVVYEAKDPVLARTIALKTIELAFSVGAAERESFEKRFFAEARVAARLSHPGILVVHDIGRDPDTGLLFIAFEHLKGRTLAELIGAGAPLEWREALRIVQGVAEALHHAHAEGVVHRDIKPANIMLLPDGGTKIMDFGIAKLEAVAVGLTSTGQFFGTPAYMAPEQAMGQEIDGRADLFSLGATAYALLTGQLAFAADNMVATIGKVARHDPAPPSQLTPGLPGEVDYVLARALAKAPADRYAKARMLAEDVGDILAGRPPRHRASWTPPAPAEGTVVSTRAALPPATHRSSASTPRGRLWLALLAAALLGAGAAAVAVVRMAPAGRGLTAADVQPTPTPAPSVAPTEAPATPAAPPSLPPAETPPLLPEPTTPPTAPAVRTRPSSTPRPRPSPQPKVEPAEAVRPVGEPAPAAAMAALAVDFEHPLKDGTLRIFLDDTLLLEERLESRARKVVGLTMRKGALRRAFSVSPGEHDVRVEVAWGDQKKTGRVWGNLVAGETRRLEIRMQPVLMRLSVEWK